MKTWRIALASALALALAADVLMAQPRGGPGQGPGGRSGFSGGPQGPGRGRGPGRPQHPLLVALDADQDGELSSDEIENAVAALKKLDKALAAE